MEFGRRLGSSAAETHVKFHIVCKIQNTEFAPSTLHEIVRWNVSADIEKGPWSYIVPAQPKVTHVGGGQAG